jgi:hypothetical protein
MRKTRIGNRLNLYGQPVRNRSVFDSYVFAVAVIVATAAAVLVLVLR